MTPAAAIKTADWTYTLTVESSNFASVGLEVNNRPGSPGAGRLLRRQHRRGPRCRVRTAGGAVTSRNPTDTATTSSTPPTFITSTGSAAGKPLGGRWEHVCRDWLVQGSYLGTAC